MIDTEFSTHEVSESPKQTSSVHNIAVEKPPFGSRFLTEEADVWSKNAWDHVPPPDEQKEKIASSLARQRISPVPEHEKRNYNDKPARHWDNFYKMNASNFFRNRKWLHTEFPELVGAAEPGAGHVKIVEVGCGAGNSVFPLLSANRNPELELHAFDYSNHAVKLVQSNALYISPPTGSISASVWDLISTDGLPEGIEPASVDIVILIFVLSALHPNEWLKALANIYKMLKPGGLIVLRDYGRHDLTQLRFKEGRLLEDNFYIRGDKTRVYFFELDDLALLFTGAHAPHWTKNADLGARSPDEIGEELELPDDPSLKMGAEPSSTSPNPPITPESHSSVDSSSFLSSESTSTNLNSLSHPNSPPPNCPPHPLFSIEQLGIDRRLLVNRKRQLKMYRVWMQGKFRKV